MSTLSSSTSWAALGKPSALQVEGLVREAQKALNTAPNELARQAQLGLIRQYLDVALFLEEQSVIAEAKTALHREAAALSSIKKKLAPNERVTVSKVKGISTARYEMVDQYGSPIADLKDHSSLAIIRSSTLDMSMMERLARREAGATAEIRKAAKEVVKRKARLESIQAAVAALGRAILDGCELVIQGKEASLASGRTNLASEYKARMALIEKGKYTEVVDGVQHTVNGQTVTAFSGAR